MKTIAYILLVLLALSFVGCEKVMNEDDATMKRQTIIMNRENYEISMDDGWVIVDGKFL